MGSRAGVDIGDFANSQPLTPGQLQGLWDFGARFILQEFTYPNHFAPMVRAIKSWRAQDGGAFDLSSYNFLYWSQSDAGILTDSGSSIRRHLDAITSLQQEGIELGWQRPDATFVPQLFLDAEDDTLTTPATRPSAERGVALLASGVEWATDAGLASGIYTNSWWKTYLANNPNFAGLPLWFASQYRVTVPLPMAAYYAGQEIGAWPVPMLWQYRGTTNVAGVSVDLNLEEWADA